MKYHKHLSTSYLFYGEKNMQLIYTYFILSTLLTPLIGIV